VKSRKIKNRRGKRTPLNEILPEYDFSTAKPNKYAVRYRASTSSIRRRAARGLGGAQAPLAG